MLLTSTATLNMRNMSPRLSYAYNMVLIRSSESRNTIRKYTASFSRRRRNFGNEERHPGAHVASTAKQHRSSFAKGLPLTSKNFSSVGSFFFMEWSL